MPAIAKDMGKKAEEIAGEKFLITLLAPDYLYMLNSNIDTIRQIDSIAPDKAEDFRAVKFVRLA